MIGYKVVRRVHVCNNYSHLISAVTNISFDTSYITRYSEHVETFPRIPGTKLFAFKSLYDARDFLSIFYTDLDVNHELWSANLVNPAKDYFPVPINKIKEYWKAVKNKEDLSKFSMMSSALFYDSWVSCDSLKLIERLC